jgi:hypothetical protein
MASSNPRGTNTARTSTDHKEIVVEIAHRLLSPARGINRRRYLWRSTG